MAFIYSSYTPHPTPHTLHPTPYTPHPTPHTPTLQPPLTNDSHNHET
ncbi:conserved hypothetical protein [Microcystis aeruginosa PCC 9717]|uniref:Uncharacterized protein n=1 Tax=Microcystis aeruginosa PCC 9717 TaxID=1160286 RepID=I4FKY8_MICAE|nr:MULTISPECIES: hypothetical protein [unclassified Microcystis]MCZ8046939.1 hypothetical protein [Microcystis sp. LE19-41.2A]CCH96313.1 conserved hypothetical protein [Microcystis aeruginosa PCC 9717]